LTYRAIFSAYQIRLMTPTDQLGPQPQSDVFRSLTPLYQTLDIAGYNLGPSGDISVVSQLRYQTDFGTGYHRDTPDLAGIPTVDGRDQSTVIFLSAEGRNALPPRLDVRLGRQLVMDDLAWYRLDGVSSTYHALHTPVVNLDVDTYVGMPVRYNTL